MKDFLGIGNIISKLKSDMSGSMAGGDSSIDEILEKLNLQSSESNTTQAEGISGGKGARLNGRKRGQSPFQRKRARN